MKYLAAICVIFCFIGSGVTYAPSQCVSCDTVQSDSIQRVVADVTRKAFTEALDSLKTRFNEVNTKHQILILKTAMLERKMCKPVIGRVDSFRTLTGWWVVKWWYVNGKFIKTTNEKN